MPCACNFPLAPDPVPLLLRPPVSCIARPRVPTPTIFNWVFAATAALIHGKPVTDRGAEGRAGGGEGQDGTGLGRVNVGLDQGRPDEGALQGRAGHGGGGGEGDGAPHGVAGDHAGHVHRGAAGPAPPNQADPEQSSGANDATVTATVTTSRDERAGLSLLPTLGHLRGGGQ